MSWKKNHLLPNSWHIQTETLHLEHFWQGWKIVSPNFSFAHLNCQQKLSEYGWEISVRQWLLLFETIWLSTGKWDEILGPFLSVWKVIGEKIWKNNVSLMMTIRKRSWWCEMFGRFWMDQRPGLENFGRIINSSEEFESVE